MFRRPSKTSALRCILRTLLFRDTLLSHAAGNIIRMTYATDDARAYVAAVTWRFASTMPRIPHSYTIRKWRPELDDAFVAFVRHIWSAGIRMDWPDPPAKPLYRNQYLLLDGWKYWTMGDPHPSVVPPIETPEATTLINRAHIEHQPGIESRQACESGAFHPPEHRGLVISRAVGPVPLPRDRMPAPAYSAPVRLVPH